MAIEYFNKVVDILCEIEQERLLLYKKVASALKVKYDFDYALGAMFKWMAKTKKVKIKYQGICSQSDYEDGKEYKVYRTQIIKGTLEAIQEYDKLLVDIAPTLEIAVRNLCLEVLMSINALLAAKKQEAEVN